MQVKNINYETIEMMFKKELYCTLFLSIDNNSEVSIHKRDNEIVFTFDNGDIKTLPFEKGLQVIRKLKSLIKDLKDKLYYCNITNVIINIKYKEI